MATSVLSPTVIDKHPDEVLTLAFEFARLLADGETLDSDEAVVESSGNTPALTIENVAISGTTVTFDVSGGDETSAGALQTYCLTCSVVTSSGNTRVIVGKLRVDDEC